MLGLLPLRLYIEAGLDQGIFFEKIHVKNVFIHAVDLHKGVIFDRRSANFFLFYLVVSSAAYACLCLGPADSVKVALVYVKSTIFNPHI